MPQKENISKEERYTAIRAAEEAARALISVPAAIATGGHVLMNLRAARDYIDTIMEILEEKE